MVSDDEGVVREVIDTGGQPVEEAGLEFYSGVLAPALMVGIRAEEDVDPADLQGMLKGQGVRMAWLHNPGCTYRLDIFAGTSDVVSAEEGVRLMRELVMVTPEEVAGSFPVALFSPLREAGTSSREHFFRQLHRLTAAAAKATGLTGAGSFTPGSRPGVVLLDVDMERWEVRSLRILS